MWKVPEPAISSKIQILPGVLNRYRCVTDGLITSVHPASPCSLPWQLSGGCELTVVIHDFTACNSNELTIRRGQTVEVLERPHDKPDWCLVRTTDRSPAAEGLVPCGSLCIAHSRSSMEMEGIFNHKGKE